VNLPLCQNDTFGGFAKTKDFCRFSTKSSLTRFREITKDAPLKRAVELLLLGVLPFS
jgi:hypothetical protein